MDAFLVFGEEKWHGFLLTLTDLPGLADLVVPSRAGWLRRCSGGSITACAETKFGTSEDPINRILINHVDAFP